jgi:hypothetical protein
MLSGKVRTGLCILVALVWTISIARQLFDPDFKPDPAVNAVFSTVIGAAITLGGKERQDKKPAVTPRRKPR